MDLEGYTATASSLNLEHNPSFYILAPISTGECSSRPSLRKLPFATETIIRKTTTDQNTELQNPASADTLACTAQELSWRNGQESCKSQWNRVFALRLCRLDISEKLHL